MKKFYVHAWAAIIFFITTIVTFIVAIEAALNEYEAMAEMLCLLAISLFIMTVYFQMRTFLLSKKLFIESQFPMMLYAMVYIPMTLEAAFLLFMLGNLTQLI